MVNDILDADDLSEYGQDNESYNQNQEFSENQADEDDTMMPSPAHSTDIIDRAAHDAEKPKTPEYKYIKKRLDKVEIEINSGMTSCNDIERTIKPVLEQGAYIRDNLYNLRAREGDGAVIEKLVYTVSKLTSAFITAEGYTKNLKFALGRMQESIDETKEHIKEEEE